MADKLVAVILLIAIIFSYIALDKAHDAAIMQNTFEQEVPYIFEYVQPTTSAPLGNISSNNSTDYVVINNTTVDKRVITILNKNKEATTIKPEHSC